MTAGELLITFLTFLVSLGLAGAVIYLSRRFFKSERGAFIGRVIGLSVLIFLPASLSGLYLRDPDASKRVSVALLNFFGELRWYHPLILAAAASVYTTVRFYARYESTARQYVSGWRLLRLFSFSFFKYYLNLLVLYLLYARTGSIRLTIIAATASVVLWIGYIYLRRTFKVRGPYLGSASYPRLNWRTFISLAFAAFPALLSLLIYTIRYRQTQQVAPPASDSPNSIWPYVAVFLFTAAVNAAVIISSTSFSLGQSQHGEYARSHYMSLLRVSFMRIFVLALFVIPAGIASGGSWGRYAVTAVLTYGLLELSLSRLHAQVAADGWRLMCADE